MRWLIAGALALATPALAQTLEVSFDEKVAFELFRTYAWKPSESPPSDPAHHASITREIEQRLAERGLEQDASGRPDVLVRYYSKVEKKTRSTSRMEDGRWQPSERRTLIEFARVPEWMLLVELYTPAGLQPAWSARATEILAAPDRVDKQIEVAVGRMFARYPPHGR